MLPVCLTIAGHDPSGGAGICADVRIFARLGVQACSIITALTAQNPDEIRCIQCSDVDTLRASIQAILAYYPVAAIKIGMLVNAVLVKAVVAGITDFCAHGGILVVDPILLASSGKVLLDAAGTQALQTHLLPLATLITPNLPEAKVLLANTDAALLVRKLQTQSLQSLWALALARQFGTAVLLKGGHADAMMLCDILALPDGCIHNFSHPRLLVSNAALHGTGCRLSAYICALLAKKMSLLEAVSIAVQDRELIVGQVHL